MSETEKEKLQAEIAAMQAKLAQLEKDYRLLRDKTSAEVESGGAVVGNQSTALGQKSTYAGRDATVIYARDGAQISVTRESISSDDPVRNAYLSALIEKSGYIPLEGLDFRSAGGCDSISSRLRLDALYTGLMTLAQEDKAQISDPRRLPRPVPALEQLDRHPHLVLLGDPGSGKTTFVNFVCWCLAGEALGHPQANLKLLTAASGSPSEETKDSEEIPWRHGFLLPVRVVLREFVAAIPAAPDADLGVGDLLQYIGKHFASDRAELLTQYLQAALNDGGLILLDGLDEVPAADNRRAQIRKLVENCIDALPHCRVLVTSRPYAWQHQGWAIADGRHDRAHAVLDEAHEALPQEHRILGDGDPQRPFLHAPMMPHRARPWQPRCDTCTGAAERWWG